MLIAPVKSSFSIAYRPSVYLYNTIISIRGKSARKFYCEGPDEFVDMIVYIVDTRNNPDEYERVKMLTDYGNKFIAAVGFSMRF